MATRHPVASQLARQGPKQALDRYVETEILAIDAKLRDARKSDVGSLTHQLATTFAVPGVSLSDAQTYIYAQIVKLYGSPEEEGGRGFQVQLRIKNESILHLSWEWHVDQDILDDCKRVVVDAIKGSWSS